MEIQWGQFPSLWRARPGGLLDGLADRDDPVIRQLARQVEEDKGLDNKLCDRGEFLYPTAYGYSESMGKDYEEREELKGSDK
jgi:hypothetical protein